MPLLCNTLVGVLVSMWTRRHVRMSQTMELSPAGKFKFFVFINSGQNFICISKCSQATIRLNGCDVATKRVISCDRTGAALRHIGCIPTRCDKTGAILLNGATKRVETGFFNDIKVAAE